MNTSENIDIVPKISLLEYYAGQAMLGMIPTIKTEKNCSELVDVVFNLAEAMVKEAEKRSTL